MNRLSLWRFYRVLTTCGLQKEWKKERGRVGECERCLLLVRPRGQPGEVRVCQRTQAYPSVSGPRSDDKDIHRILFQRPGGGSSL